MATVDNSFEVFWNGVSIFSQTNIPPTPNASNNYVDFTFGNLPAAVAGQSTLEFVYVNNDDFFRLDDVSAMVVPESSATYLSLLGFGLVGVYGWRKNRNRRAVSA